MSVILASTRDVYTYTVFPYCARAFAHLLYARHILSFDAVVVAAAAAFFRFVWNVIIFYVAVGLIGSPLIVRLFFDWKRYNTAEKKRQQKRRTATD